MMIGSGEGRGGGARSATDPGLPKGWGSPCTANETRISIITPSLRQMLIYCITGRPSRTAADPGSFPAPRRRPQRRDDHRGTCPVEPYFSR